MQLHFDFFREQSQQTYTWLRQHVTSMPTTAPHRLNPLATRHRSGTASSTAPNPETYGIHDDLPNRYSASALEDTQDRATGMPGPSATMHCDSAKLEGNTAKLEGNTDTNNRTPRRCTFTQEESIEIELLFAEDIAESVMTGNTIPIKTIRAKRCGRLLRFSDAQLREKIRNIVKHKIVLPPRR